MSPDPAAPARAGLQVPSHEPADAVAATVRVVPGVADLHTGTFGEVATYLPGRKVTGVRIREDHVEVHVVLRWGAPVLQTADAIRSAVQPLVGRRVDVTVQDIVEARRPETPGR